MMRASKRSIRSKLTILLLLPLVSLSALWGYAASLSLGNALTLRHENIIGNRLAHPLGELFVALGTERLDSVVAVASAKGGSAGLENSRTAVDSAIHVFLEEAHDDTVRDAENSRVRATVDAAEHALNGLGGTRQGVDSERLESRQVLTSYTEMTSAIAEALHAMTILPDESAQRFGQALYTLVPAGDLLSQEDALISAAAASPLGRLSPADYSAVVRNVGTQRYLTLQAIAQLPAAQRAPFEKLAAPTGPLGQLTAMEDQIIEAGPHAKSLPFPIERWRKVYDEENEASARLSLQDIAVIFDHTGPPARRALVALVLAGVLGLVALLTSALLSIRIARSLVGDVSRLRAAARHLTDDRLRDVVGRLRRGETVDVDGDMTRPVFVNREMAELSEAFFALQTTAVQLAEEDIRLHRGFSDVFLNLARRSQALIHRQLGMLDTMERREEDPNALEELFRLDQLATRMRRYAEGLIIVSGAPPGRFWRHPVPAVDVVRGAIAETEDYTRVVVLAVPPVGVIGRAAADVIHLLAELIENAQSFSPSDTQVRVSLSTASSGLVIEIDDRGLGMPLEQLEAANARIASFFDVSTLDSTQLGLVTVGRLAQRHGINVSLRQSPYGGVTAIVLVPHDLLEWNTSEIKDVPETTTGVLVTQRGRGLRLGSGHLDEPGSPVAEEAGAPVPSGTYPPEFPTGLDDLGGHGPAGTGVGNGTFTTSAPEPYGPDHAHLAYPAPGLPAADARAYPGPPHNGFPDHPQLHTGGPDMIDGLPRRVPQASLAEELRRESHEMAASTFDWGGLQPGAAQKDPQTQRSGWTPSVPTVRQPDDHFSMHGRQAAGGGAYPAGGLSPDSPDGVPHPDRPDQVRSMMAALQAGAARARLGNPAHDSGGGVPYPHDAQNDNQGRYGAS